MRNSNKQSLASARVLIVGLGDLGSPVALYLAAAGVGHLGLVDPDLVALRDLQSQVIFVRSQVGNARVQAARLRLLALNSKLKINIHKLAITAGNAIDMVGGYDLVIDCTDDLAAHNLINDACLALGRPFVYGSLNRSQGQVSLFCYEGGPCYRCFQSHSKIQLQSQSTEDSKGNGAVAGVIGTLQATEALKILRGEAGGNLAGKVLTFDPSSMTFSSTALAADSDCVCRNPVRQSPTFLRADEVADGEIDAIERSQKGSGGGGAQSISPAELAEALDEGVEDILLLDVRALKEHRVMRLRGSKLLPLQELPDRLAELIDDELSDPERPVVVYCRSGVRSRKACSLLRDSGFDNVRNLTGGILAWYREFEEKMIESDAALETF